MRMLTFSTWLIAFPLTRTCKTARWTGSEISHHRCSHILSADNNWSVLTGLARYSDAPEYLDRKSTRLNSSHQIISYAVFCLKKKKNDIKYKRRHVSGKCGRQG